MFRKMQFYQRMLLIVVAWSGLIAAPQAFAYKQITAGGSHTCGLKSDGSAICWGAGKTNAEINNEHGQSTVPSGTFTQLSAGLIHTCGLKSDGSAICWGNNYYGQTSAPSGTFTQLSAGQNHTCGLRSDGSATCWGSGPGATNIPNDTFTQLSAGTHHTCGLKSDGSAICWGTGKTNTGNNYEYGQSSAPSGTFTQLSAGWLHTCGLKSDGSVICWGSNSSGQTNVPVDSGVTTGTPTVITKLDGISTNAFITPANKMIAGVLISGGTKRLMVRASSVDGAVDPSLEFITYPDRKPLGSNDSWATDPAAAELTQKKLAPGRATDAATIINLPPGLFTMEITSKNGGSGAGIIEVYDMAVFP